MSRATQRIDFDLVELFDVFEKRAYSVEHESAMVCPCVDSNFVTNPNCPVCFGSGWKYTSAVPVQAIMTSLSRDVELTEAGMQFMGMVYVTVKPDVRLGFHDRIRLMDGKVIYSEKVFNTSRTPKLRYPILDMLNVSTLATDYVRNIDYQLDNGRLRWILNPSPTEYSVRYLTYPTWLILNFPHVVRGAITKLKRPTPEYVELPVQAMAKLEWRITDRDWS